MPQPASTPSLMWESWVTPSRPEVGAAPGPWLHRVREHGRRCWSGTQRASGQPARTGLIFMRPIADVAGNIEHRRARGSRDALARTVAAQAQAGQFGNCLRTVRSHRGARLPSHSTQAGEVGRCAVRSWGRPPVEETIQTSPPVEPWSLIRPPIKAMALLSGDQRGAAICKRWSGPETSAGARMAFASPAQGLGIELGHPPVVPSPGGLAAT